MAFTLPSPPQLNLAKCRKYLTRLPLFTRIILLVIVVFWALQLQSAWDVPAWGGLVPHAVNLGTMYRLNTYPLIHKSFFHAFLNMIALAPVLERFEAENGTLTSAAFFFGPLSSLPAAAYLLIEKGIIQRDTAIMGSSIWIFVLLAAEAVKAFRSNPYFAVGSNKIPTWSTPFIALFIVTALVPHTTLLGHLCSLAVGYAYGLGYLKILAPPEKILRWVENKLNLLGRLPHYVSIDQKTYGRYGLLPSTNAPHSSGTTAGAISMNNLPRP